MSNEYTRDGDGNVTNPPILPEYEQRLQAAHLAADTDLIEEIQADYTKARDAKVKRDESKADKAENTQATRERRPAKPANGGRQS